MQQAPQKQLPKLINRKGVVVQQDNVRPHTSLMTKQKPFVSVIATGRRTAENPLTKFFTDKSQKLFTTNEILKLSEKWQNVIDNNDQTVLYNT